MNVVSVRKARRAILALKDFLGFKGLEDRQGQLGTQERGARMGSQEFQVCLARRAFQAHQDYLEEKVIRDRKSVV